MAAKSSNGSAISSVIGIVIAGFLVYIGLNGINTHWYRHYRQFQSSASWERVPCTLGSLYLQENASTKSSASSYEPKVEFRYEHSGTAYTQSRFWLGEPVTADKSRATQFMQTFEVDKTYDCFVDPAEPSNAVLVRELNTSSAWVIRNYAIAAGIGVIMLLGHIAGFFMRMFRTSTASEINYERAMANGTCPIESGEPDEPLIIAAAESRVAVASGLWLAGICWTGIVSLIGSSVIQNKEWFPIVFVGIFFLFGILILVGAVYATLQIFNPRPILASSQRDIYPGSEFELSWMFRGDVKKIKRLEITLEGIEKVSYRQGTSTRTEQKPFFRQTIVDSNSSETMAQGFEIVTIPLSTMHSFKSSNNSFTWQIQVKGEIPFWPDITDRFEIVLLAPLPTANQK